jgi:hypothetical protein
VLYSNDHAGRLIAGCPEAISISAYHEAGRGWVLKISVRRQFQLWNESSTGRYELLSTDELVDVIEAELAAELLS